MSERIADGKGRGNLLGITNDNRADVSAKSSRRIYYASRDLKSAYSINMSCTASGAGTTDIIGYFSYSGEKNLFIDRVFLFIKRLHKRGISHRNLNLSNVWINENDYDMKFTDFEYSTNEPNEEFNRYHFFNEYFHDHSINELLNNNKTKERVQYYFNFIECKLKETTVQKLEKEKKCLQCLENINFN